MISKQNRWSSTSLLMLATAIGTCTGRIMHADETQQHDSAMTADDANAEHSLPKCLDADALREWLELAESDSAEDQAKAFQLTQQPITALFDPTINRTPDHIAFRNKAKPLVGRLVKLLEHSDECVVEEALSWLYDIGPGASECAPELKTYFATCDPSRRALVVQTLLAVTPEDTPVGPFVLEQLSKYLKELTAEELSGYHLTLRASTIIEVVLSTIPEANSRRDFRRKYRWPLLCSGVWAILGLSHNATTGVECAGPSASLHPKPSRPAARQRSILAEQATDGGSCSY